VKRLARDVSDVGLRLAWFIRNECRSVNFLGVVMVLRTHIGSGSCALLITTFLIAGSAHAQSAPEGLNQLGPEGLSLAAQAGQWDVTETVWATPGASPVVTKGVAVRRMIGPLLEETLHSGNDLSDVTVDRIDYLTFNRVEGHWNYVSMDVRAPVGIMTANSFERDPAGRIRVTFAPFAVPASGPVVVGQLLRMEQVIETHGDGSMVKNQYFILADGTSRSWLAHRYAYVRRQTPLLQHQ
jgi:hypothetical protein